VSYVDHNRISLTLYASVLDDVVANGAYRAINMATFNAGFRLAWLESPSKYKRPPERGSAKQRSEAGRLTLC
jgi:hypothetical protein